MTPASGSQKRISRWAVVVLPAPEGPTSATVRPAGTVNVAPSRASRRFLKYENVTSRTSISTPPGRAERSLPRPPRGPDGALPCPTLPESGDTLPRSPNRAPSPSPSPTGPDPDPYSDSAPSLGKASTPGPSRTASASLCTA